MIYELMPRLISHHESQIAYYELQRERAVIDLARVSMLNSGQLSLFEISLDGSVENNLVSNNVASEQL